MRHFFVGRVAGLTVLIAFVALAAGVWLWMGSHTAAPVEQVVATTTPVHTVIGHSVEDRSIDAYTYGSGDSVLLFVGGIHGGYEWNSVVLAYTLMDYLDANPGVIPANIRVTIVPSANPDGVYKIVGKEGRFTAADVPESADQSSGRFNAHEVDLNRNFDCNWQAESAWRSRTVSAGTTAFSEPESKAIRDFVFANHPVAAVFFHSQANAVYASECGSGVLPETTAIMNTYADAAGYPAVASFDSYTVTGDAEGWLASLGIPAITVELKTHKSIEWDSNLKGVEALFSYFGR